LIAGTRLNIVPLLFRYSPDAVSHPLEASREVERKPAQRAITVSSLLAGIHKPLNPLSRTVHGREFGMKRIVFGILLGCIALAGAALADDGPIKQRQALMKKNGEATKVVSAMLKGEKPYDAAAAAGAMKTIGGTLDEFITLFPEGSTSKDSAAKPEIWQNKKDFNEWATGLKAETVKAAAAAEGGPDSFKKAFAEVAQYCKGCHEKYRAEKKK
jgi:cytochrome c556